MENKIELDKPRCCTCLKEIHMHEFKGDIDVPVGTKIWCGHCGKFKIISRKKVSYWTESSETESKQLTFSSY